MKNQVIKVLSREHGEKVIQYWKDKGIDTGSFSGNMSDWYYGVIDGKFGIYGSYKEDVEVITLPELPEKWFIVPTEDTVKDICKWFDENHNSSSNCNFYSNKLRMEMAYTNAFNKNDVYYSSRYLIKEGIPEISIEQFKQITKMKEEKKIIGYKLIKLQDENNNKHDSFQSHIPYTISEDSNAVRILKKAEVLDLWFEPIYEEEVPQLPIINCYSGNIINNKVVYGCAQVPFSWFKDPFNETIASLTLNRGTVINKEQMEQIRKVIDYHHNKK